MPPVVRRISILGTRGVPAAHGGFETFAERLALHLNSMGWDVTVYCQQRGREPVHEDRWQGVRRVHIAVPGDGPGATMAFDWRCIRHAAHERPLCLTLGYNTAAFCAWLRLHGVPNVINMDGVEWRRAKWSLPARMWFWLNDWAGCWLGNHLVADHPEIKRHLATRVRESKITTIPYGADAISSAPIEPLRCFGLEPGHYFTLIARPEPENSVLEIVKGFSRRRRGTLLAVLGAYRDDNSYHRAVRDSASDEVRFLGAVYDPIVLQSLRLHCLGYLHGHQVGGTNPSLVEALAAGNVVIAHDNPFNRWVAGSGAHYFRDVTGVDAAIAAIVADPLDAERRREQARTRHHECFQWAPVLNDYTALLSCAADSSGVMPRSRLPQS